MDQCRQASTIIAIGVPEVMFAKLDYFKAATTFVAKSLKAGSGDKNDKQEDKKSLLNFIKAKKVLENTSDEENLQRINTRIKDIKMRMDEDDFRIISEKYDN